jgi:hypothetical protein
MYPLNSSSCSDFDKKNTLTAISIAAQANKTTSALNERKNFIVFSN